MRSFWNGLAWRLVLSVASLLVLVGVIVFLATRAYGQDKEWRGCATNEHVAVHVRGDCGEAGGISPPAAVEPPQPKPPVDPKPPKDEEYEKPGKPHHGGHKGKWQ